MREGAQEGGGRVRRRLRGLLVVGETSGGDRLEVPQGKALCFAFT